MNEVNIYGNRQDEFACLPDWAQIEVVEYCHGLANMMNTARNTLAPMPTTVLDKALAQIGILRSEATAILESYTPEHVQFDAAYQVWQDLDKAYDALSRTQYIIVEGLI